MKTHAFALFAALCLASPCAAENGGKLIAEIMHKPGNYNQMCGTPDPLPFNAPVPVFSERLVTRHFYLGPKETARLQKSRAKVVPAMLELLKAMDFTKPPAEPRGKPAGNDISNMTSGLKPQWLNSVHFQIIAELNAVETLPELLRLEDQLHGLITAAEKDSKAALPPLDLDSPVEFLKPGEKEDRKRPDYYWERPEYKRDTALFTSRVLQREMLGTVTLLLQQEQWPAVTERFAGELKKERAKQLAEARKDLADTKKYVAENQDRPGVESDKLRLPGVEERVKELEAGTARLRPKVAWSPALRTEIRTMAEAFLTSVPPEKRRAAAGMPAPEN